MCEKRPSSTPTPKITDVITTTELTYSLEVTPDIPFDKIEKTKLYREPTFYSVTWHAKLTPMFVGCEHLEIAPLKLARYLKSIGKTVCLHISCDLLRREYLDRVLENLQENGICNLFVILGENYDGSKSVFKSSKHLIQYIRKTTGDYFCIGVAGHPDDPSTLKELKEKIDRGANFILTQAFYKHYSFRIFEKQCEHLGINVPIIPSIFMCEQRTGAAMKLVSQIRKSESGVNHIHFFTMNYLDKLESFIKEVMKKEPLPKIVPSTNVDEVEEGELPANSDREAPQ